jgi:ABC-2 type transport system permease protein
MRLFLELAKRSFQRQIAYRAAAIAGLATNFFFGMLRIAVFIALYGTRQEVAGISLAGAITFTGLTQAIIGFQSLFGWYEMMNSIYTGAVASDLLKPMGYFRFWLALDAGRAMAQLLLRGVTMMVIYASLFGIVVPKGLTQWLAFSVSLMLAWWVCFAWRYLINLAGFWTPNALGIGRFGFILIYFFSGFLIPLRFFPDWLVQLCNFTPFPHMVNTVVEVYLGVLQGPQLVWALLAQVAWVVILVAACELTLRAGVRRLVILGG